MKMSLRIDRLDIGKENGPSAISWALEKKSTIAINKKKNGKQHTKSIGRVL